MLKGNELSITNVFYYIFSLILTVCNKLVEKCVDLHESLH